jgi:prolycopene isomerase
MAHDVVVVGGGIGGLTAAALLSARGVDVCLLERQPEVGGCVVGVEKFGYTFEPALGLYSGWGKGEIFDRIFSELPVAPPEVRSLSPTFVVRIEDGTQVPLIANEEEFQALLRATFPECAERAVHFYRDVAAASESSQQARQPRRFLKLFQRRGASSDLTPLKNQTVERQLTGMPERFRRFIELQLLLFANSTLGQWSFPDASRALAELGRQFYSIRGGAATLAGALAASIRKSGGSLRLSNPVLRLSYNERGEATGVDLLTGENVQAKVIISNMTVWDTYGKLIGLQRTPGELRRQLNASKGSGAYLIYAAIDEETAKSLPEHLLVDGEQSPDPESLIDTSGFAFAVAPEWDTRGPDAKRAVTIVFRTDVDRWFTYHEDHSEHEEQDQAALELAWNLIHKRLPELGSGLEVIETATPQTYYDLTRRKLGMVGTPRSTLGSRNAFSPNAIPLPNVFIVSDTITPLHSITSVVESAITLVNKIVLAGI